MTKYLLLFYLFVLICLSLFPGCSNPVADSEVVVSASPKPDLSLITGCVHGAYIDWTTATDSASDDYEITTNDIEYFETSIADKAVGIVNLFRAFAWGGTPYSFPSESVLNILNHGAVPMITWEPRDWDPVDAQSTVSILEDICNGNYDGYMDSWISEIEINFTDQPLFIRFGHEMNGNWYSWSGSSNGGSSVGPALYQNAYRYVVDYFNNNEVDNVSWVWCVNNLSVPDTGWNTAEEYYPGDSYVDVIGIDGYNSVTLNGSWQTFDDLFSTQYAELLATHPDKPLMLAEFASTEGASAVQVKSTWITDAFTQLESNYPAVKAALWFYYNDGANGNDWRVDTSIAARSAYQTAVGDGYIIDNW